MVVFGTGKAAYDKDHEMADADSPIRPFLLAEVIKRPRSGRPTVGTDRGVTLAGFQEVSIRSNCILDMFHSRSYVRIRTLFRKL